MIEDHKRRNADAAPCAVEAFDKEWGVGVSGLSENPSPFPRINDILRWMKDRDTSADAQRARIVTEAYKKYAMYPQNIKCAMALRDVLEQAEINIHPGELIVGELAAPPKCAPIYPEFSMEWLCEELEHDLFAKRSNDVYIIDEKTKRDILALRDDWKGRTVSEAVLSSFSEDEMKGSHAGKGVIFGGLFIYAGVGHVCADYETLLRIGFGGIRERVRAAIKKLDTANPADIEKKEFYEAERIMLEGAISHIGRYGRLAGEMAAREAEPRRREELLRISENCLHVAEGAPRDFWEAIQLWHIATNMIIIESNGHSVTYGRFDKLFYPFYKRDIETGRLSRAFMQELIEAAFLKMHQLCKIRDKLAVAFSSGTIMGGTALDVGGVDEDGADITNDLSYMVLDAHAHTRIPNPWMGVRLHAGSPVAFKIKVFNVIRIGTGEPKVFNDEPMIEALRRYGKPLREARDYVGIGCVEPAVPGKTYGWHDSASFNTAKVLQLAINGGRCIDCGPACPRHARCAGAGGGLGPDTGSLADFQNFDAVLASFDKQMKYWCDLMISGINKTDIAHRRLKPLPYLSLLVQGCIEKGTDVSCGGAIHNHSGPQAVGPATAADSLTAIRQWVFDEKRITGKEFLKALRANWRGYEWLKALVNSDKTRHYGNDDDYADEMFRLVIETYCKYVEHRPTPRGGAYMPGVFSVSNNVLHGSVTAATPDGREAYEPVSDCLGPVHTRAASHDRSGPTAIANSVTKYDHSRIANGVILNWKFSTSTVAGETGRDNLISFMDAYFERKGMQSQFNIIGKETLLAAQAKPAAYKDLLVRVAGYSAYFTELNRELQNDLIARTELSFD